MIGSHSDAAELARCRRVLMARAQLERHAMQDATEDLQEASDRFARIAIVGIRLVRRYWLPGGVVLIGAMFKRARPALRAARTGLALWQTARLLRNARR